MSGWTKEPPALFGRDMVDFFRTSGGVLVGEDFDQEVCWESPLIDLNGGTQFSVDLTWAGFDNQADEYINVNYSIDGGGYVTIPNVVGGGTGTIQYASGLDQNGSTTVTKNGLSGGTIQIQVCGQFNANAESMTLDNVSVPGSNQFCPAPEPSLTPTNVTCNGEANGAITNTVSDGQPPYTYVWSNGATTQNLSNLGPGTYTVTVTDANMSTGTASANITQPAAIVLSTTQVNLLCNGASTGSIDLMVSGGIPGYTYNWGGGITTQDRSNLAAGTYTVTVTDASNCTKTISASITQPTAIVLTETHVNVLCNGQSNGSIDLSVSGGTPAYTYNWGGGITTQDRSNLAAGTYTVTVTDANSCTKTLSASITQPSALVLSTTQVNVLCTGNATGSIDLTVNGGTPAYSYNWTGGITTQDRSNLASGTYTVTVTDANNCTKTISATITEPAEGMNLSSTQVNVLC
ncbi:MAG: SprB repeat-containing protein, partial [Saprospiraceae bacterium]|nr:SprB repeat-containing protein [Saprospiraceae bacterium]